MVPYPDFRIPYPNFKVQYPDFRMWFKGTYPDTLGMAQEKNCKNYASRFPLPHTKIPSQSP